MKRFSSILVALLIVAIVLSGCASTLSPASGIAATQPGAADVSLARATSDSGGATSAAVYEKPLAAPSSLAAADPALASIETALQQIYDRVNPSVVMIEVVASASTSFPGGFPGMPGLGSQQRQGLGSGFVWDTAGHIVTNNHVVKDASSIVVRFYDGATFDARLVGSDADSDLAVIKVDAPAALLRPVTLGDSTAVKVGQWAIAIGNPFGEQNTMTTGIISALGRSLSVESETLMGGSYVIPDVLQTDAPINPGNSGGVLLDALGRVIGVTSAIESATQSSAGIGFAVPSVIVSRVVPSLIKSGSYTHPWLGITGGDLSAAMAEAMNLPKTQRGALVTDVVSGGPAASGGVKGSSKTATVSGQQPPVGGDVIIAINSQSVKAFNEIVAYLARYTNAGDTITLTVLRDGKQQDLKVTLQARPSARTAADSNKSTTNAGGYLGITGRTVTSAVASELGLPAAVKGVVIDSVVTDSPAADAGLRKSDVIVGIGSQTITSMEELKSFLQQSAAGDRVTVTITRDGRQARVRVVLGAQPTTALPVA